MTEKWCDSQWQTCGINIAQKGVSTAKVQIVDKTEIVTVIVSMDATKGVDTIALHGISQVRLE